MKKTALITGISGQDGAYLSKFLLKKNYNVIGTDRRSSRDDKWRLRYLQIENKILIEDMDLLDITQIIRIFERYKINEVYNLGAQSFVASSFNNPISTTDVTALGCLRLLEVIRNKNKKIKFYQASSSEMYGDVLKIPQDEKTPFNPRSPYAVSKLYSHFITKNYREAYNIYAVSGICFNHESPLRGEEFITRKITSNLAKIENGSIDFFELGNLESRRDWGYAGDFVEAMWKTLQQKKPEDYVISTGKSYSVKEFIDEAVKYLSFPVQWYGEGIRRVLINKKNNKIIIKINKKYFRPTEVDLLIGNSNKLRKKTKWKPKINFKELVKIMMLSDLKKFKN
jgi:GDPmannose 4,6-dehydratase